MGKLRALLILTSLFGAVFGPGVLRAAEDDTPPPSLQLVVSIAEQKLAVLRDGGLIQKYPISTSKFGIGDSFNSYRTPLGRLRICEKIGDDLPLGAVLKRRNATGEILPVNSPGRDPIVTRILWLDGLESANANAKSRGIYIHGTVEESKLGQPVSYGCIRMRSRDVVELFDETPVGTTVEIIADRFPRFKKFVPKTEPTTLFASNNTDTIKTTIGPRGMVVVRTSRLSAVGKPVEIAAAQPPPPKLPEPPAKAPEPPTKTIAKAPKPAPNEPVVLLATASHTSKKLPLPAKKTATSADEPRVLLMDGSILFADLEPRKQPAAKEAPEPEPEPVATGPAEAEEALEPAIAAEPLRFIALDVNSLSFTLLDEESAPTLDALSLYLLYPPAPEMRLALRAPEPKH